MSFQPRSGICHGASACRPRFGSWARLCWTARGSSLLRRVPKAPVAGLARPLSATERGSKNAITKRAAAHKNTQYSAGESAAGRSSYRTVPERAGRAVLCRVGVRRITGRSLRTHHERSKVSASFEPGEQSPYRTFILGHSKWRTLPPIRSARPNEAATRGDCKSKAPLPSHAVFLHSQRGTELLGKC